MHKYRKTIFTCVKHTHPTSARGKNMLWKSRINKVVLPLNHFFYCHFEFVAYLSQYKTNLEWRSRNVAIVSCASRSATITLGYSHRLSAKQKTNNKIKQNKTKMKSYICHIQKQTNKLFQSRNKTVSELEFACIANSMLCYSIFVGSPNYS